MDPIELLRSSTSAHLSPSLRPDPIAPLLTDTEVSRITGRARSTLQKDRVAGTGIPWVRIGRQVRYRREDVVAYLAALPRCRSTAEADALAAIRETAP